MDSATDRRTDRLVGMLVGLAVGDALGMPAETAQRGQFPPITGMRAGGPSDLPAGFWTDDTTMALCLADSILARGGYDGPDVMSRYTRWLRAGYRSSTGRCFDIGAQTRAAIEAFERSPRVPRDSPRGEVAGNGSVMRLAPVVIAGLAAGRSAADIATLSRISGRETHYGELVEGATAIFGGMLVRAATDSSIGAVLEFPGTNKVTNRLSRAPLLEVERLRPTGFVVDTLEAAAWALSTTDTFEAGALKAVNLGGDSDTIGAVFGQLAGAFYGCRGIPPAWIEQLHQHEEIIAVGHRLAAVREFAVLASRFAEDDPTAG